MERVVEISDRPVFVSLHRGFLKVREKEDEIGSVPLADIGVVIVTGTMASLSSAVMAALMEQGTPVVICGPNYHPTGMMLPVVGHFQQTKMLKKQIDASEPFKKRLWQKIVQTKVLHQAKVLADFGKDAAGLRAMADRVRSGDPNNMEARAAREYWPLLLGADFRRQGDDPINGALNYGYAVIRAHVARSLVACGLQPALGIHHDNAENPFCLADDMIEIYRPCIDRAVFGLKSEGFEALDPEAKRRLIGVLNRDIAVAGETSTVANAILRTCQSLTRAFETREPDIIFPDF